MARWVARRGKKPIDAHDPSGLREARTTAPSTWGTRVEAELVAARIDAEADSMLARAIAEWVATPESERKKKPTRLDFEGGIGVVLGDLGNGLSLGGIDLDTCIGDGGRPENWAVEVIMQVYSYSETSPSGTGIKSFFTFRTEALGELRAAMNADGGDRLWKRAWKGGGGEHPPAIEIHLGGLYFTFTGEHRFGTPKVLQPVRTGELLRVIEETGPAFERAARASRGTGDDTRSGRAWKLACQMIREGADMGAWIAAMQADGGALRDWCREKEAEARGRELI
jgi:putative DNA primase/helicase